MSKSLIVVDMQKGFMTKPNYVSLVSKIQSLIDSGNYEKIYFTKFVNRQGSLYQTKLNWFNLTDDDSTSLVIECDNATIFEKYGYGLTQEQLKEIIALNEKEIDVCGVETEACVYAIAFQLFDNGIFPNVLKNYVATATQRQEFAINLLIRQFGSIDERK